MGRQVLDLDARRSSLVIVIFKLEAGKQRAPLSFREIRLALWIRNHCSSRSVYRISFPSSGIHKKSKAMVALGLRREKLSACNVLLKKKKRKTNRSTAIPLSAKWTYLARLTQLNNSNLSNLRHSSGLFGFEKLKITTIRVSTSPKTSLISVGMEYCFKITSNLCNELTKIKSCYK